MSIIPDSIINESAVGSPDLFSAFRPAAFHTRIFLAYLGDWFIGDRITTVSGEKSADRQTFQASLAGAAGVANLISQNLEQELTILAAWRDNYSGEIVSQSPILTGRITATAFSKGGRSATLMVYCRAESPPPTVKKTHHADGIEFFSFGDSGSQIRLPLQMSYEPGDRVVFADGEFDIQKINYTINTASAIMTVTG